MNLRALHEGTNSTFDLHYGDRVVPLQPGPLPGEEERQGSNE